MAYPLVCVHTTAGVIDADYRGNVGVVLFNLAQEPYEGNHIVCGGNVDLLYPW